MNNHHWMTLALVLSVGLLLAFVTACGDEAGSNDENGGGSANGTDARIERAKWSEAQAIASTVRSALDVHIAMHNGFEFEAGEDLPWLHWSDAIGLKADDLGDTRYFLADDVFITIAEGRDSDTGRFNYEIIVNGRGAGNLNREAPAGRYRLTSAGESKIESVDNENGSNAGNRTDRGDRSPYRGLVERAKWSEAEMIASTLRSSLDVHTTINNGFEFEAGENLPWEHWSDAIGLKADDLGDVRYFSTGDLYLTISDEREPGSGRFKYTITINGRGAGNENPEAPTGRYRLTSAGESEIEPAD